MHQACTEAYIVTAGAGYVQTLTAAGYAETELVPGRLVWFSPGAIHRLVNADGKLEILVVMQNSGLPEAGDFVLAFPAAILADDNEYQRRAVLSGDGGVGAGTIEAAYRRRDLSIEGFSNLKRDYEIRGAIALSDFYECAVRHVSGLIESWRQTVKIGAYENLISTNSQLDLLERGDPSGLYNARVWSLDPKTGTLGMCGVLDTYRPEGVRVKA